jgi:hypothetical protein
LKKEGKVLINNTLTLPDGQGERVTFKDIPYFDSERPKMLREVQEGVKFIGG